MRIYLGTGADAEELNFTLSEKISFAQIIAKLTEWAESQKLFIIDYRVAAKPEFTGKEDLDSSEIEVIELQLGDQTDLIEANLRELIDYTDRAGMHLAKVIQEGKSLDEREAADLKTGGVFITESISAMTRHLKPENADGLTQAINNLNSNPDLIEKINGLAAIQNQLRLWLRQAEFSRVTPEAAIEKVSVFRSQLSELDRELEQVAAKLTQGREQEALQKFENISQILVDAIILMRIAKDAKVAVTEKLVKFLDDLTQAIDRRDLVTAADIADFDLRDALKELTAA